MVLYSEPCRGVVRGGVSDAAHTIDRAHICLRLAVNMHATVSDSVGVRVHLNWLPHVHKVTPVTPMKQLRTHTCTDALEHYALTR